MSNEDIKKIKLNKLKEQAIILMKNTKKINTKGLLALIVFSLVLFFAIGNSSAYTQLKGVGYESLKNNNTKITFGGDVSPVDI